MDVLNFDYKDEYNHDISSEDENLKKAIEASLNEDLNKTIELSKNNDLQLYTEELQLEKAIKLSLSIKQPVFNRPLGKIYIIDHIFKDIMLSILIQRGCLKDLYSFCLTRWDYYDIIRRDRDKLNDKLLSLKQIHPSSIKFQINSFERSKYFKIDKINNGLGNTIYTKQYYLVANSDKCGCVSKNTTIFIRIPTSNTDIIIGRTKNNNLKTFKCNYPCYFYKKAREKRLTPGLQSNDDVITLLNSCVYDPRCDDILDS